MSSWISGGVVLQMLWDRGRHTWRLLDVVLPYSAEHSRGAGGKCPQSLAQSGAAQKGAWACSVSHSLGKGFCLERTLSHEAVMTKLQCWVNLVFRKQWNNSLSCHSAQVKLCHPPAGSLSSKSATIFSKSRGETKQVLRRLMQAHGLTPFESRIVCTLGKQIERSCLNLI